MGKMSLLKIECLVNPMKETKLATDEKVKSVRLLHSRSPKAKHATSNGICLNEDYSKEGWKRQNKVNMVGEDEGLIRLEKLRPVPPPTPMQPIIPFPDGDEEEEDEGGSISVAMLHPMRIDSGFLCKKHRTEESFPRELIYFGGNFTLFFPININVKTTTSLINIIKS